MSTIDPTEVYKLMMHHHRDGEHQAAFDRSQSLARWLSWGQPAPYIGKDRDQDRRTAWADIRAVEQAYRDWDAKWYGPTPESEVADAR